ncbi:MAG: hypothetical protein IRZ24_18490 [Thermogemmatispora sp.]|nr:hypothetical protein [Thermogemmatispora sp.]
MMRIVQFIGLLDAGRRYGIYDFRHRARINGTVRVAADHAADAESVGTRCAGEGPRLIRYERAPGPSEAAWL